jgi:PKD repeat protein
MADRISTLDKGYVTGDLSIFPEGIDSNETLYRAVNNAESVLTQSLTVTSKFIIVADASAFPESGIIRVGNELIFYTERTATVFKGLKRGFAGSAVRVWLPGTRVQASVMAEHHNAVMDAVINIETDLGLKENPSSESLNGILKVLEQRFLAPKPLFRAVPRKGPPSLEVRFQNFSGGPPIRFLWDFGDGGSSVEVNPTHVYTAAGVYTVKLNMITELGGTGVAVKTDYIVVNEAESIPFFYFSPSIGTTSTTFTFIDQTQGNITNRYWIWDDGTNTSVNDPDEHVATHTYTKAGQYSPNLLLIFADGKIKRVKSADLITITE